MFNIIKARMKQGYNTSAYPQVSPVLPQRYCGLPQINGLECNDVCSECIQVCPVSAISRCDGKIAIDLGKCLFCAECVPSCPSKAIVFTKDYRMAASARKDLLVSETIHLAKAIEKKSRKLFGHSLKLRQVSAGGCNACEADVNVLGTLVFDLSRFGIQFVASPRHADGILVTGPVSKNMELALRKTLAATSTPKFVIAVGSCAISGGPFAGNEEVLSGIEGMMPVDLYIPGCPPHPWTILDGMLRLLGQLEGTPAE